MKWLRFIFAKLGILDGREITVSAPITWTGWHDMKNLPLLLSACFDGINNPEFAPDNGVTYCNFFVNYVASRMGCNDFKSLRANDIVDFMSASDQWSLTPIDKAQFMANLGTLVIAGEKADPHGHVAIIVPGMQTRSAHWSMSAPLCANVGKDVFVGKGLSYAFQEIPRMWAWRPSL